MFAPFRWLGNNMTAVGVQSGNLIALGVVAFKRCETPTLLQIGVTREPGFQYRTLTKLFVLAIIVPPKIEPTTKALRVESGGTIIASTKSGQRVLETAGAPTYYFPPQDVNESLVRCTEHVYHCEWKGISRAFAIQDVANAGWLLTAVYPEFSILYGWYAFYPQQLRCFVGRERVRAQPGGYYGGWVTHNLLGPIKGEPGSDSW